MSRAYYIYWYKLDGKDFYLIWFEAEESDGVLVDRKGFVPSFGKISDLQKYAEKFEINVDVEKPILNDLDAVQNWLNESKTEIFDYNPFLNAWNLFADISLSTSANFDKDKESTNKIYDKIFWGCNISAVTPEGESFTPGWTKKELKTIREVLSFGFQMFREKVKYI
jgi:hypothetical protein